MGQTLSTYDSSLPGNLLSQTVLDSCKLLTACTFHPGSLLEVRRLYERFRKTKHSGHHLSHAEFQLVTHHSPIEGLSDAYQPFEKGPSKTVNVLEFLAALVLVSAAGYSDKVLFLVHLFDFDNNKCLTRDEITILCVSAVNGFCCLIGHQRVGVAVLKQVSEYVFETADLHPNGLVTYDELLIWTKSHQDLMDLLERYSLGQQEEPDLVFLYMHEAPLQPERKLPKVRLRSLKTARDSAKPQVTESTANRSFEHAKQRPRYQSKDISFPRLKVTRAPALSSRFDMLLVRGKRVTKEDVIQLKRLFDRMDTRKDGKLTAEQFRQDLAQHATLQSLAGSIFSSYDSSLSGSLTFQEMLVKTFRGATHSDISTMTRWVQGNPYKDREQERYMRAEPDHTRRSTKRKITIRTAMQYKHLFDLYDKNKDGALDLEELRAGLGSVFPQQDLAQMMREYDSNHDDKISLMDFIKLMAPANACLAPDALASLSVN